MSDCLAESFLLKELKEQSSSISTHFAKLHRPETSLNKLLNTKLVNFAKMFKILLQYVT